MEAPTRQSVGRGDSNASTTNDVNQRRTVIGQGQRNQMDLDVIVQWLDEEIEILQRVRALLTGHESGGSRCSAEFFYRQAAFIQIGHDREVFLHFSLFD